jgi:hypothetical protein
LGATCSTGSRHSVCPPPSGSADTRGKTEDATSDLFMHQGACAWPKTMLRMLAPSIMWFRSRYIGARRCVHGWTRLRGSGNRGALTCDTPRKLGEACDGVLAGFEP